MQPLQRPVSGACCDATFSNPLRCTRALHHRITSLCLQDVVVEQLEEYVDAANVRYKLYEKKEKAEAELEMVEVGPQVLCYLTCVQHMLCLQMEVINGWFKCPSYERVLKQIWRAIVLDSGLLEAGIALRCCNSTVNRADPRGMARKSTVADPLMDGTATCCDYAGRMRERKLKDKGGAGRAKHQLWRAADQTAVAVEMIAVTLKVAAAAALHHLGKPQGKAVQAPALRQRREW